MELTRRDGLQAQMQLQRRSKSCEGDYVLLNAQLEQYMGTFVQHMSTSKTPREAAPEMKSTLRSASLRAASGAADFEAPNLRCSFPALLHPQYEKVKEQCDRWILDVAQPPSAAGRQLLLDCVLPRLICRTIPSCASITRLVQVAKMVGWLIIADDEDDHPDALGADDDAITHNATQVLSILRRPPAQYKAEAAVAALHHDENATMAAIPARITSPVAPTQLPESCSRYVRPALVHENKREAALHALSTLWAEMQREMSPRLCARFVSSMEDYFNALKVQATHRKANRLPDVQAFKEIRRHASFVLPCFVLVEYALNIELDDETYANALIQDFRNTAADYICLCNDLVSCKVEIGVGDYFNMPAIVYMSSSATADRHDDEEWTLQNAVNSVAAMAHHLDAQCVSMLQTILDDQLQMKLGAAGSCTCPCLLDERQPVIRTYLSGLCSSMSGTLAWYLETPRYNATPVSCDAY